MERVTQALSAIRCGAADTEMELHARVEKALTDCGLCPKHEHKLGSRCRIDFMVDGIGIEVKKNRPESAKLRSQLARYAAFDEVGELLVIAPRGVNLPKTIGGKRVTMMALERLWGISLP